jgi:hypothetical protein
VSANLPDKIESQITKAGLPQGGQFPYLPRLMKNARGDLEIAKAMPRHGPKRTKKGYVDDQGRIWIKEHAHAGQPVHWDVQIDDGLRYIKVDIQGNPL